MSVRDNRQFSFVEALMPQAKGSGRLERLSGVVKWYRFEKLLSRLRDEKSAGRPAYEPLVMFKALLLQSLYGLSDMELEEALGDRLSFKRFVGLTLEEAVPDHSTLCRFRNLLIGEGLLERLFGELDRQLDAAGLILRRGWMRRSSKRRRRGHPGGAMVTSMRPLDLQMGANRKSRIIMVLPGAMSGQSIRMPALSGIRASTARPMATRRMSVSMKGLA